VKSLDTIRTKTGYKNKLKVVFAELETNQGEFAKRIGVNQGTMSAIVNNKQLPEFDTLYEICRISGKSIDELWIKVNKATV
jgi:putative transcriptional regulator